MFLPETTSLCPGDNFFVPLAPQRQLGRFDVCQASQHLKEQAVRELTAVLAAGAEACRWTDAVMLLVEGTAALGST